MSEIKLPKLKPLSKRVKKKKILLLSDDLRLHSGIATMSREIVTGTAHEFDWLQLGAAIKHPDTGKIVDLSEDIEKRRGIDNVDVRVIPWSGYGNPQILRHLLRTEKPDAILHFTDPRFWGWLYDMETEIRQTCPIMYYAIWDDTPVPHWNASAYESCDLIMGISKQSHNIHKLALADRDVTIHDWNIEDKPTSSEGKRDLYVDYVPHGVPSDQFYPITPDSPDYGEFVEFNNNLLEQHGVDFIVFWNNRNIRRKQPGDVILAYKEFCEKYLKPDEASRCMLLMHTQGRDENGTDLPAVINALCPNLKVVIDNQKVSTKVLNFLYNVSDVTLNIASNEGFGLSSLESIMSGTPIVNNVTGGLQDQLRFKDDKGNWIEFDETVTSNHTGIYKECGEWGIPVFPASRSLQGSIPTPYIFDDRCKFEDVGQAIYKWYAMGDEERKRRGLVGRDWAMSEESRMSAANMSNRFVQDINKLLKVWKPKARYSMYKVADKKPFKHIGIV